MRAPFRIRATMVLALLLLLPACAEQGSQPGAGEGTADTTTVRTREIEAGRALDRFWTRWVEAVNAKDVDGLIGLVSEDFRFIGPGAMGWTDLEGRDAYRELVSEEMGMLGEDPGVELDVERSRLHVHDDRAYTFGTLTESFAQPEAEGGRITLTAAYAAFWQRSPDGEWRLDAFTYSPRSEGDAGQEGEGS